MEHAEGAVDGGGGDSGSGSGGGDGGGGHDTVGIPNAVSLMWVIWTASITDIEARFITIAIKALIAMAPVAFLGMGMGMGGATGGAGGGGWVVVVEEEVW